MSIEGRRRVKAARTESKARVEKKSEIDRRCREMGASGSTSPSARVFRKFDKSRPTISRSSFPLLLLSYLTQSRRTHRPPARASDEISSSSQSLVIPGAFWVGTRYTLGFPPRKLLSPPPPYWSGLNPHSTLSVPYAPRRVHCLPLISSSNFFYFCESIVGHDLDATKELTRNGRDGEMVNRRVIIEIHYRLWWGRHGRILHTDRDCSRWCWCGRWRSDNHLC